MPWGPCTAAEGDQRCATRRRQRTTCSQNLVATIGGSAPSLFLWVANENDRRHGGSFARKARMAFKLPPSTRSGAAGMCSARHANLPPWPQAAARGSGLTQGKNSCCVTSFD